MLWAQVLKAKYFPHMTFFANTRCTKGSYIWHLLSLGLKLLLVGMSWIVRDGKSIRIWKDQWLPRGYFRSYIKGPISIQDEDQRVSTLRAHHFWTFNALNFLPPSPCFWTLSRVFQSHNSRDSQTLLRGPTIMAHAPWNLPLNSYIIHRMSHSMLHDGNGFGP